MVEVGWETPYCTDVINGFFFSFVPSVSYIQNRKESVIAYHRHPGGNPKSKLDMITDVNHQIKNVSHCSLACPRSEPLTSSAAIIYTEENVAAGNAVFVVSPARD